MSSKLPWYKNGLPFSCTECGKCCTGSPGAVWLTEDEIRAIAEARDETLEQVLLNYVRVIDGRYSLQERRRGSNYDCVFLDGKRCTIYEARPTQCRTYPWWPQNLESRDNWERTQRECEGINEDAKVFSLEEIQSRLQAHLDGTKDL